MRGNSDLVTCCVDVSEGKERALTSLTWRLPHLYLFPEEVIFLSLIGEDEKENTEIWACCKQ